MVQIPNVRTYGNPSQSPGQGEPAKEPGRFPYHPTMPAPYHEGGQDETGPPRQDNQPSDATIIRDRHPIINRGTEKTGRATSNGGGGFGPDPMKDGPARPSLRIVNRTFNPQFGTDRSRNDDDLTRGYRTVSTGQWAGSQDGSTSMIWGGTPGFYSPYGSYGGYIQGPVQGLQGPQIGAAGDGTQIIPSSPPHGLHSVTEPNTLASLRRARSTVQQKGPRVDRPSNSPIAGQSFSQTVLSQGRFRLPPATAIEGPTNPPHLAGPDWRGA
jgi:hypothetical protein